MKNRFKILIIPALLVLAVFPSLAFAGPVRIALLPWKVSAAQNAEFLKVVMGDMLAAKVGRDAAAIEVIKGEPVKDALAGAAGEITDRTALEAGKKLGADYVLYGSLFVIESAVNVEARLVRTADANAVALSSTAQGTDSMIALTDKLSSDVLASVARPSGEVEGQPGFIVRPDASKERPFAWKSKALDGVFVSMDSADVDGDGTRELLLVSTRQLLIARIAAGSLDVIKEIKPPAGSDLVYVCAVDADGDGLAEVYVSGFDGERPDGFVVEFRDKDFAMTAKGVRWFMRAVDGSFGETGGRKLIGQKFRDTDGFYGPLTTLVKKDGAVVDAGAYGVDLPSRSDIYRFNVLDLTGGGAIELVSIDQRGYLRVHRKDKNGKWRQDYKSKDYFGGTLNQLVLKDDRPGASSKETSPVEGRWFAEDLDKNGKMDIIIRRNTPGGLGRLSSRPGSFVDGVIMSLSWDRTANALEENWKTRKIAGYVADFFINRDTPELVVLSVEGTEGLTSGEKSYILTIPLSK